MVKRIRRRLGQAAPVSGNAFIAVERNPQIVTAACLTVLSVVAIGVLLYVARAYMLPIAAAFVFAVVLAPLCGRLEWMKIPTPLAALLALIIASGVAYAGFSFIAAPAAHWLDDAPKTLKKAEAQIHKFQEPLKTVSNISHEVDGLSLAPTTPKARTVVVQGPELTESLIASAQVIAIQGAFVLVLTYFFLATREDFRLKLIAFQPKLQHRVRAARAFRDVEKRVSEYIATFSLINIGVGVAVGLACWQLKLPEPAMWGGIAAILNFVPYLGPAVTVGLMGLAGLATYDTLLQASFPILAYFAVNTIESNLVTPLVMSRRMTLNPLAIMLAVSFWTWIWGPVGGIVSLPLLIMLKVVCDHTPVMRPVGALIGGAIERSHERGIRGLFGHRKPATDDDEETETPVIPEAVPIKPAPEDQENAAAA
ncbi:MAG: AI-2E family transporter [Alphaproteobacteria bacterium]|nr:AI-2E family transporter [Alphaproteobacteria bacterium]